MVDYVAGFYGIKSWFWSHIGKSINLYFRAQAWENALCIKKQCTHTIMTRTKDYRRALWLPTEFQFYNKFPYLQGTLGHFYGDCRHSWDVFEMHLVWLTGALRRSDVTGCHRNTSDWWRISWKLESRCPCLWEILSRRIFYKWLRGIRVLQPKESNPTTSPIWLTTLSPLTDQGGPIFLAQTQKIICIIHAGQLLELLKVRIFFPV